MLPAFHPAGRWIAWMDTSRDNGLRPGKIYDAGKTYPLQARSMVVMMERRKNGKREEPGKDEVSKEESSEAPS
jgi:hypothetical protein